MYDQLSCIVEFPRYALNGENLFGFPSSKRFGSRCPGTHPMVLNLFCTFIIVESSLVIKPLTS